MDDTTAGRTPPTVLRVMNAALPGTGGSGRCPPSVPPEGARRRRLWELGARAHCPVIGVGLPVAALRRLSDMGPGCGGMADDYALHCCVIAECRTRTPLAERVHKALDARHAVALQRAARLKTEQDLAAWWQAQSASQDLPGALWALLTHPRCTPALEDRALGAVHMLQHQLGAATRADTQRLMDMADENQVLGRLLAHAQARAAQQAAEHAQEVDALQRLVVRLRAEALLRTTETQGLREELRQLRTGSRQRAQVRPAQPDPAGSAASTGTMEPATRPAMPALATRTVLCVGGRQASVPAYRRLIEDTGGRFLHHDGGLTDSAARLDATLAAADLVICQTGCISHDAYWRVQDHCRRTGKRCVHVQTPSRQAWALALVEPPRADTTSGTTDTTDTPRSHQQARP